MDRKLFLIIIISTLMVSTASSSIETITTDWDEASPDESFLNLEQDEVVVDTNEVSGEDTNVHWELPDNWVEVSITLEPMEEGLINIRGTDSGGTNVDNPDFFIDEEANPEDVYYHSTEPDQYVVSSDYQLGESYTITFNQDEGTVSFEGGGIDYQKSDEFEFERLSLSNTEFSTDVEYRIENIDVLTASGNFETRRSNLEFAYNSRGAQSDQMQGLGITNNPYEPEGFDSGDHTIIFHYHNGGNWETEEYEPDIGTVLKSDHFDTRISDVTQENEVRDPAALAPFNRNGATDPTDECSDAPRFKCNLAFEDGNGYWWDLEGDVLVTENDFWLCDQNSEGETASVAGQNGVCDDGKWEGFHHEGQTGNTEELRNDNLYVSQNTDDLSSDRLYDFTLHATDEAYRARHRVSNSCPLNEFGDPSDHVSDNVQQGEIITEQRFSDLCHGWVVDELQAATGVVLTHHEYAKEGIEWSDCLTGMMENHKDDISSPCNHQDTNKETYSTSTKPLLNRETLFTDRCAQGLSDCELSIQNRRYYPEGEIIMGKEFDIGDGEIPGDYNDFGEDEQFHVCDGPVEGDTIFSPSDESETDHFVCQYNEWEPFETCGSSTVGAIEHDGSTKPAYLWDLNHEDGEFTDVSREVDCSYDEVGKIYEQGSEHFINDFEENPGLFEPYSFKCTYNEIGGAIDYDGLDGFETSRFGNEYGNLGNDYDEARIEEARNTCLDIINGLTDDRKDIIEEWGYEVPVAEYYSRPADVPMFQSWHNLPGGRQDIINEFSATSNEYEGLKHFHYQSLLEAHQHTQDTQGSFSSYSYRTEDELHEENEDCDDFPPALCQDNWEPMHQGDDMLVGNYISTSHSSIDLENLYGDSGDPWKLVHPNAREDADVQTNFYEGDVSNPISDEENNKMTEETIPGGFAPNCQPGMTLQRSAGEWICQQQVGDFNQETYMPLTEEIGQIFGDLHVGVFLPPSTFEYYPEAGLKLINEDETFTEEEWIIEPEPESENLLRGEEHEQYNDDEIVLDTLSWSSQIQEEDETEYEQARYEITIEETGQEIESQTVETSENLDQRINIPESEFNDIEDLEVETRLFLKNTTAPEDSDDRYQFAGEETTHRVGIGDFPENRTHLEETDKKTAARQISESLDGTQRVTQVDSVCYLGEEDLDPGQVENMDNDRRTSLQTVDAPVPPQGEQRSRPAPLPINIGTIDGETAFDHNQLTCTWQYQYGADGETEWFTASQTTNLAEQNIDTIASESNRNWTTTDLETLEPPIPENNITDLQNQWQTTVSEEGDQTDYLLSENIVGEMDDPDASDVVGRAQQTRPN